MHDTTKPAGQAAACLASVFSAILEEDPLLRFEDFEERALAAGHAAMAAALGLALERLDARLCASLPAGQHVHDVRKRTLATQVGDVAFTYRRVRDEHGCTVVPFADALDLPWGCRVSPAAKSFLVDAGAEVSYAKAARLMQRAGGSRVSATCVMRALRAAGGLCAEEDAAAAEALYGQGIVPDAELEASQISLEVDGTWIRLQGTSEGDPKRVEVKALVAYGEKVERGRKVVRTNAVRHACVGSPEAFWTQGMAAVGARFDLSKLERCHVGQDGEGWCSRAEEFLPGKACVTSHLDPFHVNRAVMGCFADPKAAWHVLDVLWDGGKEEAARLLEACRDLGVAREKAAGRVIGYLRNNMGIIDVEGPSLGTMESENQHLYGARMDSVPCAWSKEGASAMARVRSRIHSKRGLPRQTRERSLSPKRAAHRERRVLESLARKGSGNVVKSVGRGYLPPHQASVSGMSAEVRFAAGLDSAMVQIRG